MPKSFLLEYDDDLLHKEDDKLFGVRDIEAREIEDYFQATIFGAEMLAIPNLVSIHKMRRLDG